MGRQRKRGKGNGVEIRVVNPKEWTYGVVQRWTGGTEVK